MIQISLIIPVLNESNTFESFLNKLQPFRNEHTEIIIVDGGSRDDTINIAKNACDKILSCEAGRAKQMNLGASQASGSVLLFLHADTILPPDYFNLIFDRMNNHGKLWGRFDVSLSGREFMFRVIENMINFRSCLTGIATGDQAMFVESKLFKQVGGFLDIPLMEDVALSKALKQHQSPACIKTRVITSSRRWEQYGIWRTIILMWRLRWAYYLGASPKELKKRYL